MDTVENKNLTLKHGSRTSTRYIFTRNPDRLLGKFMLVKTSILSLKLLLLSRLLRWQQINPSHSSYQKQ